VIRSNWTGSRRDGLDPFSPRATPIPRRVRAIRPSIVLEVGPGALAPFVAGDRVGIPIVEHAGGIACALQVAADRIRSHHDAGAPRIVVDLHIAADLIGKQFGARSANIGIVVDPHIAADEAAPSNALRGIVIAREISADRDGSG
jgi:hypothetical protein